MSPVELRQMLYEAAADELSKNESNVVEAIVVHRVVERVIQEAMPFLDSGKDDVRPIVGPLLDRNRRWWRGWWQG